MGVLMSYEQIEMKLDDFLSEYKSPQFTFINEDINNSHIQNRFKNIIPSD